MYQIKYTRLKRESAADSKGDWQRMSIQRTREGLVSEMGPDQRAGCGGGTRTGAGHSMQRQEHEQWRPDAGKQ